MSDKDKKKDEDEDDEEEELIELDKGERKSGQTESAKNSEIGKNEIVQEPESTTFWEKFQEEFYTYRTDAELRVRNRYLGYMSLGLLSLIITYLSVHIFLIEKMHIHKTLVRGDADVQLLGNAYSLDNQVWDFGKQISALSNSNMGIAPCRIRVTSGQKNDQCGSSLLPCKTDSDCDPRLFPNMNVMQKCVLLPSGRTGCQLSQWCPSEDISDAKTTQVYDLVGVNEQALSVRSIFSYPNDPDHIYTSYVMNQYINFPEGGDNSNTYSLSNLLLLAGIQYSDVKLTGCVLNLVISWDCDLGDEICVSTLKVKRIDAGNGYAQNYAKYYVKGGKLVRDLLHYSAIKVIVSVEATFSEVSTTNIYIYSMTAFGLILGIQMGLDLFLISFSREKNHYADLKFIYVNGDNLDSRDGGTQQKNSEKSDLSDSS